MCEAEIKPIDGADMSYEAVVPHEDVASLVPGAQDSVDIPEGYSDVMVEVEDVAPFQDRPVGDVLIEIS